MSTPPPTPFAGNAVNWPAIVAAANAQRAALNATLNPAEAYLAGIVLLITQGRVLAAMTQDTTLTRAQLMLGVFQDLGSFANDWASGRLPLEFETVAPDPEGLKHATDAALKKMTGGDAP